MKLIHFNNMYSHLNNVFFTLIMAPGKQESVVVRFSADMMSPKEEAERESQARQQV